MRHKYATRAIVLSRLPAAEESVSVALLTEDFGVVYARSQGARKLGSKMSAGLQTLSQSEVTLLRGKDIWRMAGAMLETNYARTLDTAARARAARVLELAERLIRGEHADPALFALLASFLAALPGREEEDQDAIEVLAVVRLLQALGNDAGETFGGLDDFSDGAISEAKAARASLISRSNRGIAASGL
jgi:DNA repair protein RecO